MNITVKDVPPYLTSSLIRKRGHKDATAWIDMALSLTEHLAKQWGFEPYGTLSGGTKSLCIMGMKDDAKAVMKLSPIPSMGKLEIDALSVWGGCNVPAIFNVDSRSSSFLMEYLDEASYAESSPATVMNLAGTLNRTDIDISAYPHLEKNINLRFEWAQRRISRNTPEENILDLAFARELATVLLNTTKQPGLIHGDFQMKNMINTGSGLYAIDPMPCVGDSLFDPALWAVGASSIETISHLLRSFSDTMEADAYNRFILWAWCISVLENDLLGTQTEHSKSKVICESMSDSIHRSTWLTSITS